VDKYYKGININSEGACSFETETKEQFLERMARYINDYQIEINYNIEINGLERRENFYIIKAGTYPVAEAYVVIIATGVLIDQKATVSNS